jgi:hypothetical protein
MEALQIARDLIDMGVPVFSAYPNHGAGPEFIYPDAWPTFKPNQRQVDLWRPGMALAMVTGVVFDVLDIDPRNGGEASLTALAETLGWDDGHGPAMYGQAATPSAGEHLLMGRTFLAKTTKLGKGLDLQSGDQYGQGRGFVFIAPTVRVSKYGPRQGEPVEYRWTSAPSRPGTHVDAGLERLREHIVALKPAVVSRGVSTQVDISREDTSDTDAFDYPAEWTVDEANRVIDEQTRAVMAAGNGEVNSTLGGAARVLGRFVAGGYLAEDTAVARLTEALELGGVHSDRWNVANRKGWTAATVIAAGLANGAQEPWTVGPAPKASDGLVTPSLPAASGPASVGAGASETHGPGEPETAPTTTTTTVDEILAAAQRMEAPSAAVGAYWLQGQLGQGALAGFFRRDGRIVHTPLIGEIGYTAPRADSDDNGPAQIREVSPGQLAAKIQYAYSWYKIIKGKDNKPDTEVPGLFPTEAAKRAVDAPEALSGLRTLAGITVTPMVREDGSVLESPGYDPSSRYLFLPGPGVNVPRVPERPEEAAVVAAVALLDEMLAGFADTWETKDDRANYLGMLLTPMLRLLAPPTYKMFGIGAHQPGSGKTLLADIATALHGGVLRSETPEDEAEWRKQITSLLSTTSAPVIHIDNVTGVLKSSSLAGTLTAGQAVTDRELGSSRMITTVNDRLWVVTGNNLSLGGDLVRRTIIINIDPNMPNPETRTDFAIPDLIGWVHARRNDLLHALLVMIRHWVAEGAAKAVRAQSDSFAPWEATVAGILAACGVAGQFDAESGKRAARGGDDDGLVTMLGHLRDRFGDREWTVAEALDGTESAGAGEFINESRDWLPSLILDKLARSEAGGRKSLGRWLLFRIGRWVTDESGSYVLRQADGGGRIARWRVDIAKARA